MEHYTYEGFKNFLDTYGIPETLPKKGCEKLFPFLYTKRMKKYTDDLERLWNRYVNLQTSIKRADQYLKNTLLDKFDYKDRVTLHPNIPEFTFSDICTANSQLSQAEQIFKEYKTKQLNEAERIKDIERTDFLHKVIQEIPKHKNIICLTTYSHPLTSNYYQDIYNLRINQFIKLDSRGETIFLAFPVYSTPEELENIISEWKGVPKYAVVQYFSQPMQH